MLSFFVRMSNLPHNIAIMKIQPEAKFINTIRGSSLNIDGLNSPLLISKPWRYFITNINITEDDFRYHIYHKSAFLISYDDVLTSFVTIG